MNVFARSLLGLALGAGLMAGAASAQTTNIEWTSGSPGGSWFTIVTGLSNIIMEKNSDIAIRVVPGGGRDNPTKLDGGISQMGMGIDFLAAAAAKGAEPYAKPHKGLMSMGGTWAPAEFHVIVDAKETRSLAEIMADPKLKIGTSPKATSEELTLQRALAFYKNEPAKVSAGGGSVINGTYTQLISAFDDGQIDVIFGAGSAPTGIALEVENGRRAAKLIAMDAPLQDYLSSTYGYGKGQIPAKVYSKIQPEGAAVSVTTLEALILVHESVSEDVVYRMTKTLLENRSRFGNIYKVLERYDPAIAWQNQPVPLHPGAAKAYKELGYMK